MKKIVIRPKMVFLGRSGGGGRDFSESQVKIHFEKTHPRKNP